MFSKKQEMATKDMSVVKILSLYPLAREVLKRHGIAFIGKQLSPLESIEKAAIGNGLSGEQLAALLAEINEGILEKKTTFFGEVLRLTPRAAEELNGMLAKKPGKKGIRLRLVSDGCALYSYDMDFGTKKLDGEIVFKTSGLTFYLEKKMMGFLQGTEIDYQGGFLFLNPNVKGMT